MKDKLTKGILDSSDIMRKSYTAIISNAGKSIALITALVAILITFTEVGIGAISSKELMAEAMVITAASYVIYFSMRDAGYRLGNEEEGYKSALSRFEEARAKITPELLPAFKDFVREYKAKELKYRKEELLLSIGLSMDECAKKQLSNQLTKRERKVARKVEKMKMMKMDHVDLLNEPSKLGVSYHLTQKRGRLLTTASHLIPSTIATVFTVSIILTIKKEMTSAKIIEGLIRLSTLPISALKGYLSGYRYKESTEYLALVSRAEILEGFLIQQEKAIESDKV